MVEIRAEDVEPGSPRSILCGLFDCALRAADPMQCVPQHLPDIPAQGRVAVIGAGKASAAMAKAVEAEAREHGWFGRVEGLVVTRYQHGVDCEKIEILEASHPVPDAAGEIAAQRILELVTGLSKNDTLICLISGGGSALLALPADGVSADEKAAVNRALLRSGAPIDQMNCVRKHISAIKGGRLAAAACPARVVCLMISDVPFDDPSVIASGPTVPDPTTVDDALEILGRYEIDIPGSVRRLLEGEGGETPKPGDPIFENVENRIVSKPAGMLTAVERYAADIGLKVISLGADLEGEARDLGCEHAVLAKRLKDERLDDQPIIILSGGETTVTVRGDGRGGRNAEYALGLAIGLDGAADIHCLACDTDGIDGVEDNAGVLVGPDTLERARISGISVAETLARNDAYGLFSKIESLVMTGPTRTNVNDFRAILIL